MESTVDRRLAALRGAVPQRPYTARTIAALTSNPGCARRAVLDAAGVDKAAIARHIGFPPRFGQSQFAITRGNAFEAQVKANGCMELLKLLREKLELPPVQVTYTDLDTSDDAREQRHVRAVAALTDVAGGTPGSMGTLFDHPMLCLDIGGRPAYLEPDLIAFHINGQFHVVEIKSFAVIDGHADGTKVAAAAVQSAVYVLALRTLLSSRGVDPELVSHNVVLVCPENFSNKPTAAILDVRRQLGVLRRQLARMANVEALLDELPPRLTLDCSQPSTEVGSALSTIRSRYSPECLAVCELCFYCRREASGHTAALGKAVREDLGGVETVADAIALAEGSATARVGEEEAATVLRIAARLRAEALS